MRHAAAFLLVALVAAPAAAQVRVGPPATQGVPPAFLPPAGFCRVWYDQLPPSRQPAPVSCRDAERIAARDRRARVIYGAPVATARPYDNRGAYGYRPAYGTGDPRRGGGYGYGYADPYGYSNPAFERGYRDGFEKGREDARDRDGYDPVRHRWYRSGDRGYDRDFGPKDVYKNVYREAFRAGYDEGYRGGYGYAPDRRDTRGFGFYFRWWR